MKITIETTVAAPIDEVRRAYTTPDDIKTQLAARRPARRGPAAGRAICLVNAT